VASSPPPATDGRQQPVHTPLAHPIEVVWGAPSTEMLEAEARGEILLIEDMHKRSPEGTTAHYPGSND
jgi:hypothetical protein